MKPWLAAGLSLLPGRQDVLAIWYDRGISFFDSEDPAGLQDIFRQLNREDLKKAGTDNRLFISNWNYDSVIRAVESRL